MCIPLQCSFTPPFPPLPRHHTNIALEPPNWVFHTPVAAILCLNFIPLLMINNQPTTDPSHLFNTFVIAHSTLRLLGRSKRRLLHSTSPSGQPFPSPSVYSDCSSGNQLVHRTSGRTWFFQLSLDVYSSKFAMKTLIRIEGGSRGG
ncbi:hypothetical protein K443DRAFT_509665 [Laccaria amethystina LaAM-08-1]|uniref:Unplaced genomic scaffold K443scaffold_53, whole genome shotgun sequence n=1 Tax=Laccaria amethystina LaAM-08-1 TaxID=1095629 RepID=A0A0C9Y3Q0_9AGAR|nr:hypothetical protein K443DRAFT_509665 [Laccaria amethystina LaAM-08-1]